MKILSGNNRKENNGQVMVMVIIMIGGILLSATAITGILMVYQIRQANDAGSSAQAFFAADAALEWQLANVYKNYDVSLVLENGTTATSSFAIIPDPSDPSISVVDFTSQGFSGNTVRALETVFTQ
jgi:hypothetical protein